MERNRDARQRVKDISLRWLLFWHHSKHFEVNQKLCKFFEEGNRKSHCVNYRQTENKRKRHNRAKEDVFHCGEIRFGAMELKLVLKAVLLFAFCITRSRASGLLVTLSYYLRFMVLVWFMFSCGYVEVQGVCWNVFSDFVIII